MGWSVQGHLQWAPLPCLVAECLDLESLQPFSPNHGLILREALAPTFRFCSLKQPQMGHHRFGSLLITYLSWGGLSNYLLASRYHLRFPASKVNQFRKMEETYAEMLSSFSFAQTPWTHLPGQEGYRNDKITGLELLQAFSPCFVALFWLLAFPGFQWNRLFSFKPDYCFC